MAEMDWVVAPISAIRAARSEMNVPARAARSPPTSWRAAPDGRRWIAAHRDLIRASRGWQDRRADADERQRLLGAKSAIQVVVGGVTLCSTLPAPSISRRSGRVSPRNAGSIEREIDKSAQKLGNEQFLAKAKPEVVEEQRERQIELRASLDRVQAALARIA